MHHKWTLWIPFKTIGMAQVYVIWKMAIKMSALSTSTFNIVLLYFFVSFVSVAVVLTSNEYEQEVLIIGFKWMHNRMLWSAIDRTMHIHMIYLSASVILLFFFFSSICFFRFCPGGVPPLDRLYYAVWLHYKNKYITNK